jgi:circadian clock protein KaiB
MTKAMRPPADSDVKRFNPAKTRGKKARYTLRLYVAGFRQSSRNAIANIRRICDKHFEGSANLEVIDIYQQPELAAAQQIIASPTLIKEAPAPFRRVVGDLSDTTKVLAALGVRVHPPA